MKDSVFWDVALCRTYENRLFEGTCRLHLQVERVRGRAAEHTLYRHSSYGRNTRKVSQRRKAYLTLNMFKYLSSSP
jgi:hypothetical protein